MPISIFTTPSSLSLELFVAFSPSSPRTSNTKASYCDRESLNQRQLEFLFHHLLGLYSVQLQITVLLELRVKIIIHGVVARLFPTCYVNMLSVAADNCLMTSIASISLYILFSAATASSEKSRILL
jgi:hypothetical protein